MSDEPASLPSEGEAAPPRREYVYTLDRDGTLHHAGDPITHERVLRQFFRNLRSLPDGRYLSICAGEHNHLEAEDTPFVVVSVRLHRTIGGRLAAVDLILNDSSEEPLDVKTLGIGENDVLYCRVRGGDFPARFRRAPQWSLLSAAEEHPDGALLEIGAESVVLGGGS